MANKKVTPKVSKIVKKESSVKKPRKVTKKKNSVTEENNLPLELNKMPRALMLEYRAVLAEWKVSYGEAQLVGQKLSVEKNQPKYKELLGLMQLKTQAEDETRQRGLELQRVQELIAESVGLGFEEFRKNYAIDLETGVINTIAKN